MVRNLKLAVVLACAIAAGSGMQLPVQAESVSAAAASWTWKQQSGKESSELTDITELQSGVRIAVGMDSTVLRSKSGGAWGAVAFPGRSTLQALAANGAAAVVAGDQGVLARTKDGMAWTKGVISGKWTLADFSPSYKNKELGKYPLKPSDFDWQDVVWDGRQFVAAGMTRIKIDSYSYTFPVAAISKEGTQWTLKPIQTSARGDKVLIYNFHQKWLVAMGRNILSSADLAAWTTTADAVGGEIHAMADNGQIAVAVGYDGSSGQGSIGGRIYTTTDGVHFKKVGDPNASLNSVVWDGKQFIAAGDYGTIYRSMNGVDWDKISKTEGMFQSPLGYVKYGGLEGNINALLKSGNAYLAAGSMGTVRSAPSPDQPWTIEAAGTMNDLYGIAYFKGNYVVAGVGTLKASANGKDWADIDPELIQPEIKLYELKNVGGSFIAGGFSSADDRLSRFGLLYRNGRLSELGSLEQDHIRDITAVGGEFRLHGKTIEKRSRDGLSWVSVQAGNPVPSASSGKVWIGFKGQADYYTSIDGAAWKKTSATLDGSNGYFPRFTDAVWTGSKFIAISEDALVESVDGKAWKTVLKKRYTYLKSLAVTGGGTAAAVGNDGAVYMSEGGRGWVQQESPTSKDLQSVIWDGTRFIAVGFDGVVLTAAPVGK
ncbi:hypothetical protein [Paenibacillus humicus]|uniref:hypothetical protein n=1 Tax=Paenibacillus humicus TaxID=412861 RepID=UPI003F1358B9